MWQNNWATATVVSLLFFLVTVSGCRAKKNCIQNSIGPSDLYSDGVMNPSYMWYRVRNKIQVPVVVDADYTYKERSTILGGLGEIQHKTCIEFYVFNDTHALNGYDYVYITKAKTGCWSHIGRVGGGAQELSLGKGCVNHRTAVHEMIHALGFAHEHVRSDRDNFVYVFWQNISPDYSSIMHYDRRAFSRNGMDTLKPLKSGAEIGKGQSMSAWDVKKLMRMYKCGGSGGHGSGGGGGRGHRTYHSDFRDDKADLEDDEGHGDSFSNHDDRENSETSYQPRGSQERDPDYQGYHHQTLTFDEDRSSLPQNYPSDYHHLHHSPNMQELETPFFDNFWG